MFGSCLLQLFVFLQTLTVAVYTPADLLCSLGDNTGTHSKHIKTMGFHMTDDMFDNCTFLRTARLSLNLCSQSLAPQGYQKLQLLPYYNVHITHSSRINCSIQARTHCKDRHTASILICSHRKVNINHIQRYSHMIQYNTNIQT